MCTHHVKRGLVDRKLGWLVDWRWDVDRMWIKTRNEQIENEKKENQIQTRTNVPCVFVMYEFRKKERKKLKFLLLLFCKWFLLGRFVSCLSSKSKNVENILAKFLKHAKKQNRGHKHTHDTQGQSYSSIYENVFHMVLRIFLDAITREKKNYYGWGGIDFCFS